VATVTALQQKVYRNLRGYSINKCGFGYVVNPDSVKKCILLMNLNPDYSA